MNSALVIMGVAGCGKSSVAARVSQALAWRLVEGDAFHSPANVSKMRAGMALTDADRVDWLTALAHELVLSGPRTVLACSALKRAYRDRLRLDVPDLRFVYLELTREAALARVAARATHYFQASLVDSQFATLEPPQDEAGVLTLDASQSLETLQAQVCAWVNAKECV